MTKMQNYISFLIVICILAFSCTDDKIVKRYYQSGNLKMKAAINNAGEFDGLWEEYYETGELLFTAQYQRGRPIGTAKYYHKNKQLKEEGHLTNQLRSGWWNNYSSSGVPTKTVEYIILNNMSTINQYIVFNRKGDTVYNESRFLKLYIPDTLQIGKNIGRLKYYSDVSSKDKFYWIIIKNQLAHNKVVTDTFREEPNISRFGIYAHKKGNKEIKGVIDENYFETEDLPNDSMRATQFTRKIYFRKDVYVK